MRRVYFKSVLSLIAVIVATITFGCSHQSENSMTKPVIDSDTVVMNVNNNTLTSDTTPNNNGRDSIDSLTIPKDKLITREEYMRLPYKEQKRYRYETTIDIYQCTITDNEVKSAIINYLYTIDENKKKGDLTISNQGQWLSAYHWTLSTFPIDVTNDINKMVSYTILNNRIIYIVSLIDIFDEPWLKVNRDITKKYKIWLTYDFVPFWAFFDDGYPSEPVYFFDKDYERKYYQGLESKRNDVDIFRHKEAVVTTFDRDSAAVSAKNDTINTVIYNDSEQ